MNSKIEIEKITKCFKDASKDTVLKELIFTNKHIECYVFKILLAFTGILLCSFFTLIMVTTPVALQYFLLILFSVYLHCFFSEKIKIIYAQKYYSGYLKDAWSHKERKYYIFKYLLAEYVDTDLEKLDVITRKGKLIYKEEKFFSTFFNFGIGILISAIIACVFAYFQKTTSDFKIELQFSILISCLVLFVGPFIDGLYNLCTYKFNLKVRALRMLEQYVIEEKEKILD